MNKSVKLMISGCVVALGTIAIGFGVIEAVQTISDMYLEIMDQDTD